MADIKKFLDQGGVSTLWTRIAEEVAKVDAKAADNAAEAAEEEPTQAVEEEKKASELEGPIVVELDELVIDEGV
jgi:hypothetical protein